MISLAAAKVAAVGTRDRTYAAFYRELIASGYLQLSRGVRLVLLGTKRVNAHMAYLALLPLLALEGEPRILLELRETERGMWRAVEAEYNGLFAMIHATLGDRLDELRSGKPASGAAEKALEALRLFPDDKIAWPVDLSGPEFGFPRALLPDAHGHPQSSVAIPPYLRGRSSSLWVSTPYRLVDGLGRRGDVQYAGIDYLEVYWMGRYYRHIGKGE